jgi:hypothetical protein
MEHVDRNVGSLFLQSPGELLGVQDVGQLGGAVRIELVERGPLPVEVVPLQSTGRTMRQARHDHNSE